MRIIKRLVYLLLTMFATIATFAVIALMVVFLGIGKDIISAREMKTMNSVTTAVKTDFTNTPIVYIQSEFGRSVGAGSGVYIAPNKILTAAHVVRGNDGTTIPTSITIDDGTVQKISPKNVVLYHQNFKGGGSDDLAIITTNDISHTYYEVAKVEDPVSVRILGYPSIVKGVKQGYTSEGEVARKTADAWNLTAYSKQGSSGGAVLDEKDQLIGILVATATYNYQDGESKDLSYAVKFTDDEINWINTQIAA